MGEPQTRAYLSVLGQEQNSTRFALGGPRFTIGRAPDNQLCLPDDAAVSRHHCVIRRTPEGLVLHDLDSANGTYVNGALISGPQLLGIPCWILVGHTRLGVLPTGDSDRATTAFEQQTYGTQGSILVPSSAGFEARTEALLVVDIIDSSALLAASETELGKVVAVLGQVLERDLRPQSDPFLKCTGDGFLACFAEAEAALESAVGTMARVGRHVTRPVRLSFGLHWGEARVTPDGDRSGRDVHAVFRLESARKQHPEWLTEADGDQALILMTSVFLEQLPPARRQAAVPLGPCELRGLAEQAEVFRWDGGPTG